MKEENKVVVSIELVGADEVIQKLQEIKKILNDIAIISPGELIRRKVVEIQKEKNKSIDNYNKFISRTYKSFPV